MGSFLTPPKDFFGYEHVDIQRFSGNWTVPNGVKQIGVIVIGGGGGGSGYGSGNTFQFGGRGGCAIKYALSVVPGSVMGVLVGGAGTGAAGSGAGSSGGNSSFSGLTGGAGVGGQNVAGGTPPVDGVGVGGDWNGTVGPNMAGPGLLAPAFLQTTFLFRQQYFISTYYGHGPFGWSGAGDVFGPGAAGSNGNYNQNDAAGGKSGAVLFYY